MGFFEAEESGGSCRVGDEKQEWGGPMEEGATTGLEAFMLAEPHRPPPTANRKFVNAEWIAHITEHRGKEQLRPRHSYAPDIQIP
jgi:hypothetical protein